VYLAENGRADLDLARQEKPDVILLDWMMPELDGLQVLSELKHEEETEQFKI